MAGNHMRHQDGDNGEKLAAGFRLPWSFARRAAEPVPALEPAPDPTPEPVNHGRALAKIGHDQRRAKVRATARAICTATGIPIPAPLMESEK